MRRHEELLGQLTNEWNRRVEAKLRETALIVLHSGKTLYLAVGVEEPPLGDAMYGKVALKGVMRVADNDGEATQGMGGSRTVYEVTPEIAEEANARERTRAASRLRSSHVRRPIHRTAALQASRPVQAGARARGDHGGERGDAGILGMRASAVGRTASSDEGQSQGGSVMGFATTRSRQPWKSPKHPAEQDCRDSVELDATLIELRYTNGTGIMLESRGTKVELDGREFELPCWPGHELDSFTVEESKTSSLGHVVTMVAKRRVGVGQLVTTDDVRPMTDYERTLKTEIEDLRAENKRLVGALEEAHVNLWNTSYDKHQHGMAERLLKSYRLAFRITLLCALALIGCMVARDWPMVKPVLSHAWAGVSEWLATRDWLISMMLLFAFCCVVSVWDYNRARLK